MSGLEPVTEPFEKITIVSNPSSTAARTTSRKKGWIVGSPPRNVSRV